MSILHFTTVEITLQNHVFSRIVHFRQHESTSYRSSLMLREGPVGSWNFSGRPCALGGSWHKYIKTMVLFGKTNTCHSLALFWTPPKRYIPDYSKCMKTIVSSTSGSKARRPSNQASWEWFWWLLEPRLESGGPILHRKSFCYRIIVHWVICSWALCLLFTEPVGDPHKICVYAQVSP